MAKKKTIKDYQEKIRQVETELREAKERSLAHHMRIDAEGYNRGRRFVTNELRNILGFDLI